MPQDVQDHQMLSRFDRQLVDHLAAALIYPLEHTACTARTAAHAALEMAERIWTATTGGPALTNEQLDDLRGLVLVDNPERPYDKELISVWLTRAASTGTAGPSPA